MTNDPATTDRPTANLLVRWANRLVVVAMLVGVIGLLMVVRLAAEYDIAREGLDVPCVKGLSLPEARRELRRASPFLSLRVAHRRPSAFVPAGVVLDQATGCGGSINTLEPILVVVSTGG